MVGENNPYSKDTNIIQMDLSYRNGPIGTFRDSASTNAKSCIQEANAPYSNRVWDWLGSSSGALAGSELPVNQCPGCREGQQPTSSKSVANRSRKVINSSILHSLDCISITAPSSDLQQEKHQQS